MEPIRFRSGISGGLFSGDEICLPVSMMAASREISFLPAELASLPEFSLFETPRLRLPHPSCFSKGGYLVSLA